MIPRRPCRLLSSRLLARLRGHLLREFVWLVVDESDAGLGEALEAHVAPCDGPLVVLFGKERPDKTMTDPRVGRSQRRWCVCGSLFQPFMGVVGPDLTPMRFGEPGEGQNIAGCTIEVVGGVDQSDLVEIIDDRAKLGPHGVRSG